MIDDVSLNSLNRGSFMNCALLTSIKLPESIIKIYGNCFMNCTNLETLEFPPYLEEIHGFAFSNCVVWGHICESRLGQNVPTLVYQDWYIHDRQFRK